jgi:hypothetical protein
VRDIIEDPSWTKARDLVQLNEIRTAFAKLYPNPMPSIHSFSRKIRSAWATAS